MEYIYEAFQIQGFSNMAEATEIRVFVVVFLLS